MTLTLADSPVPLAPDVARSIGGWVLVEGKFGRQPPYATVLLRVQRRAPGAPVEEMKLPVSAPGLLEELVLLPPDASSISWVPPAGAREARITLRRVGWLERVARMHWRVFFVAISLPIREQLAARLTIWRTWADPAGAYRDATSYRMAFDPAQGYEAWAVRFCKLGERDHEAILAHIARFPARPRFRVSVRAGAGGAPLERTLESLRAQLYPEHEHAVAAEGDELRAGSTGDWLMTLQAGDVLTPHALYWFACEALRHPEATLIYADDDRIDARGIRSEPRFKPDWSPALFEATDYIGRAAVKRAPRGDQSVVRHIPAVLLHCGPGESPRIRRVRHALPEPAPLVSVIVPTRDALELLEPCIESVLTRTRYPRFELLVVDHCSRDPAALAYLERLPARGVRLLRQGGRFNYSAINNRAAREARGDLLCLLNNDTEVITQDWLEEMVGHLMRPGVGAVGAKLLYPDGRVQHAGVTVGPGGCAHHLHVGLGRDDPGYCGLAAAARECSAVTGACLLTPRDLYFRLGGLNERFLPVTFNDIDYCLRVQEEGLRVIWTPHAELYHRESASRGTDDGNWRKRLRAFGELKYMRLRWRDRIRNDPYYNPNFSYLRPDFSLSERARVANPWRA